jgi:hypothetical protein
VAIFAGPDSGLKISLLGMKEWSSMSFDPKDLDELKEAHDNAGYNLDELAWQTSPDNLTWALDYARRWPVLALAWVTGNGICGCKRGPECPHTPGKHPLVLRGAHGATQDKNTIVWWWRKWPQANIGIQTGFGLLVVDVDPRNGGDASLGKLLSLYGKLPSTPVCATGGGGWHYYFAHPDITALSDGVQGYPGIDIKKWGGYVIAPPSHHFLGGTYRWLTDWRMTLAPVPAWLLKLITEKNQVGGHGKVKACKVSLSQPSSPKRISNSSMISGQENTAVYISFWKLVTARKPATTGRLAPTGPPPKPTRPL